MTSKELRSALKRLKMSQGRFAAYVGVTRGAVSHWVLGVRPVPGPIETLVEILLEERIK